MTPTLDLILGATCLGRTRLGVALAAAAGTHCPVVALDRIQCYTELAIGSGRPSQEVLGGRTRLYLDTRPLADGPISAAPAADRLTQLQRRLLEDDVTALVMEGGSISLLHALLARPDWCEGWTVRVTVCVERSASRYETDVATRVEQMLGYGTRPGEARTLQHELAALWDNPLARKHASDILGYQQAIDLCEIHGLSPKDLTGQHGLLWRYELAQLIRAGHLAYARQQRRALAAALPALEDIAERVELCET